MIISSKIAPNDTIHCKSQTIPNFGIKTCAAVSMYEHASSITNCKLKVQQFNFI
jgi:hypothetical protein